MKILYHHRTQAEDGQAVHIRSLIGAFRSLGHELREEALVPRMDKAELVPSRGADQADAWPLMNYVPTFLREIAEYGYSVPAGRRLLRAQAEFGADFIYERYAFGNVAGIRASEKLGVPIVLEVNSPMVHELMLTRGLAFPRMAKRVEGKIFRSATRVSVVSAVLGKMVEECGVPPERIVVTPNGVHLELFDSPNPAEARADLGIANVDGPVLGFVGYFREWHGLEMVIEGLASEGLREAHLVLVGYGPAEESLRQAAERCRVADRVHFPGPRKHPDIPAVLPAFDVGLVPAINAYASPLKLQEYMAAGLPTVAPDQPNLREVLTHGEDGLLFEPGSSAALVAALSDLVGDESQRRRLGAAARQTILDKDLTWQGIARRIIRVVESL
ncbi:MAG: glycosyltransferase involved in cell wall biosynthesis [Planctomycetota bacterium]|jgi:glycosyltransferase involved in cell wall biosynthesis